MHASLSRLHGLLGALRDAASFSPHAIPPELLPHLFILDVEGTAEAPALKIRLTGTALDTAFGRSVTGHYLETFIHGPRGDDVIRGFHLCAREKKNLWMRQVVHIQDKLPRFVEGIAIHVEPRRIYGALVIGELQQRDGAASFEIRHLGGTLSD